MWARRLLQQGLRQAGYECLASANFRQRPPEIAQARILLSFLFVLRLWSALAVGLLAACSEPAQQQPAPSELAGAAGQGTAGASEAPGVVELGAPGGDDGLDFLPLADGAELRLQTFGQGGTHVIVGVRCTGFGRRAFVSATMRALTTGVVVAEPEPARPQLLYCGDGDGDGDACDLVPYLVHASGLAETNEEKNGLRVLLTARVRNEAGTMAEGSREVVLSTADL